ncbi:MAG: DUF1501 domain-containing protein [Planctomycetes bacterium]|nr:DUF1501 domain-containing protein [Planctomycetota bacterium]MBL7037554.1 DUF1501 domain-containing protein [Pirellulaceae bacterium]
MAIHATCDKMKRRDFLRASILGGAGLALANHPILTDARQIEEKAPVRSGIFIKLAGGPSHLDTFDMKPNAPAEYRGPFRPIKTNVPGVEFCEHMPKLARCADKFAILRGVTHTLGAHQLGTDYVTTGTRPCANSDTPSYGAVVAEHTKGGNQPDLPTCVAISSSNRRPGILDLEYTRRDSDATATTAVSPDAMGRFAQPALAAEDSGRFRQAVSFGKESPAFAEPFGEEAFGASCLLACRLIESGVRFVTLSQGGWDTHQDNFDRLRGSLLPQLDTALSSLLNGLAQKGLLESTAVFVTGEFGRTPKINGISANGGRDHYPRCMFMLMAGGSVRGGQVIGESDATGSLPAADGFSPDDSAASFYYNLGIDHTKHYHKHTKRPHAVVRDGRVIRELFY